jgi:hypothetical protein
MKLINYFLLFFGIIILMTYDSCSKKNNEFGVNDSFNLDTLIVFPSSSIDTDFTISWGVTTKGFPTFFLDVYLSSDDQLDAGDLKISTTSSVDINTELNKLDETQFYRISPVTGSNKVVFLHNEKSSDPNATGWNQSNAVNNPSGTGKFLIGYFYNTPGIQIQYQRRQIAVAVSFK